MIVGLISVRNVNGVREGASESARERVMDRDREIWLAVAMV